MSGTLGGGYVDPVTGMWVSTGAMPSPAQANSGWSPAAALTGGNSPQASFQAGLYVPPGTPQNDWSGVNDMSGLYRPAAPAPQQPSPAPSGALYDQPQQPPQPSPQASANADAIASGMQASPAAAKAGDAPAQSAWDVPDALQPLIADASKKYGVPENVLNAVYKQESDFGRASPNIGQVTSGTAANPGYGMNPLDPTKVNDPAANIDFTAQYLSKLGEKNGVKDWSDPKQLGSVLQAYNGGGDPNYVQNVSRYLQGSKPTMVADAGNVQNDASPGPGVQAQAQPDATQPPGTMSPTDYAKIMGQFQQQPSRQQQLLALAGGLMKGPTLGAGLSEGIGQMNNLTMAYQQHYQQAQTALAMMGVRVQNNLANQGIRQQNANTNSFRAINPTVKGPMVFQKDAQGNMVAGNTVWDPKTQTSSFVPVQGAAPGASVTNAALERTQQTNDPVVQAQKRAAVEAASQGIKADQNAVNTLNTRVPGAQNELSEINTLIDMAKNRPAMFGPTFGDRFKRYMANNVGISIDGVTPQGVQMGQQLMSQLQTAPIRDLQGIIKGHTTDNALNLERQQVVSMGTNVDAIVPMLQRRAQELQIQKQVKSELDNMDPAQSKQLFSSPGAKANWIATRQMQLEEQAYPSGQMYQEGPDGRLQSTAGGAKKPLSAFDSK